MFSLSTASSGIRQLIGRGIHSLRPHTRLTLCAISVLIASATLAFAARAYDPGERIHVGNTAGSLTTLIEVQGTRVLVGAGPTRSHSADFVGRSTRPWDRKIDLLIVPGWDDHHAVGALGLLERRDVSGIAVVGLPGDEPIWTMLERRAQQDDVPVRFLDSSHQVNVGRETILQMSELSGEIPGVWIRLEHAGARVDMLDTYAVHSASPPSAAFSAKNEHVLISMRTQHAPNQTEPALLIQPRPFGQGDFDEASARFVADVDRNERIIVTIENSELRVPLDELGS